jgi:predicted signal transduction protein with EAL and GGDEF domain
MSTDKGLLEARRFEEALRVIDYLSSENIESLQQVKKLLAVIRPDDLLEIQKLNPSSMKKESG